VFPMIRHNSTTQHSRRDACEQERPQEEPDARLHSASALIRFHMQTISYFTDT
jgi:hypothetical protein